MHGSLLQVLTFVQEFPKSEFDIENTSTPQKISLRLLEAAQKTPASSSVQRQLVFSPNVSAINRSFGSPVVSSQNVANNAVARGDYKTVLIAPPPHYSTTLTKF